MEIVLLGLVVLVMGAAVLDLARSMREAVCAADAGWYEIAPGLLTPPELSFYHTLAAVVADRAVIAIKPSLVSIFWVSQGDRDAYLTQRHQLERE